GWWVSEVRTWTRADAWSVGREAKGMAQEAASLGVRVGSMGAAELQECLIACYPLHPLTAVVLGPLFRQLAQNERSLFAFLASSEPFGFQEFLREGTIRTGPYRLDRLFKRRRGKHSPGLRNPHPLAVPHSPSRF